MLALRDLQFGFRNAVLQRDAGLLLSVVEGAGVAPAGRIAVYRSNVFHNYTEALRAVYPVVERLVGEDFFAGAARKYIVAYPSTSGDIQDYGQRFGEFLESFAPAASLPYLGEVARLEWLWHECFHGAEHAPLSLERLGDIAEESLDMLSFTLHPACRLLASRYPIGKIWSVNQPDWQGATDVDIEADGAARLLLRRDGFAVSIEPLGEGEFEFMLALAHGEPLIRACERTHLLAPRLEIGTLLRRLVANCVLVDFAIADSNDL